MEPQTQNNPTNDAGTSCVICFDTISLDQKAVIKNCTHVFCFPCIKSWMQTTITCPLCKQTIDVLLHSFTSESNFMSETVTGPQGDTGGGSQDASSMSSQLECLDHNYFIQEVQRLLHDAERRHRQLWQSQQSARGLVMWEQQQLELVQTITSELRNYKRKLNAFLQFDPHATLQDLYRLQDLLQTTWGAPVHTFSRSQSPVRYSADDADAAADLSDDDDFADDMSDLRISKGANGNGKKKGGQQRQSKSKYRTPADKIGNSKNRKGVAN